MINRIFVHGGVFHADEIAAITKISIFMGLEPLVYDDITAPPKDKPKKGWLEIYRIRPEAIASFPMDEDGLYLDFGGRYDESKYFDHHHNKSLPATNILVGKWLVKQGYLRNWLGKDGHLDRKVWTKLRSALFDRISDVDCGIISGGGDPWEFNGIIRSFNAAKDGFAIALEVARPIILQALEVATQAVEREQLWDDMERIENGRIAVTDDATFIPGWKELAERDGVYFMVSPNARGGYQAVSRDSDRITIPKEDGVGQTFCHNSGFMAVYSSKEECINHIKNLL